MKRIYAYCDSKGVNKRWYHHMIRGLFNLPHYGKHAGFPIVIYMIIVTGVAGMTRGGLYGFIGGCIFGSIIYIPMLLWGSIDRSRSLDRYMERRERLIEYVLTN